MFRMGVRRNLLEVYSSFSKTYSNSSAICFLTVGSVSMNSSILPRLTFLDSPSGHIATSSPFESTVVKFWSIVAANSSSESVLLYCYISVKT